MSIPANDTRFSHLPDIIEQIPGVAFRHFRQGDSWHTWFVTQNVSMYGYTPEEFTSQQKQRFDLVCPDDRTMVNQMLRDYEVRKVNAFQLHYRLIAKNGERIPVTEYNTIHRDPDDNILCCDSVLISNSQCEGTQRLIENHYHQQAVLNDILLSLQDAHPEHVLQIILSRTGEYLNVSRALLFREFLGDTGCKVICEWCNRGIPSVMEGEHSPRLACLSGSQSCISLRSSGSLLIHSGQVPPCCQPFFEQEHLTACAVFAVYLDGKHYGFVSFDDCVEERTWDEGTVRFLKNIANLISTALACQHAAKELEQSRKTYESVLDNVGSYILVVDAKTDLIAFANSAFRNIHGEDCIGQPAKRYLQAQAASFQRQWAEEPTDYPELYHQHTGQWLSVSANSITWLDGKPYLLLNCYDITSKKLFADTLEANIEKRTRELRIMSEKAKRAKEKVEDAARAKSQFLANMSHEMRTPLNAIIGMTRIAKYSQDPQHRDYCIDKIAEASIHLLGVINDILDMSKIESGRLDLVYAPFDFEKMLMRTTNVMRYSLSQKEHTLLVSIDDAIPRWLVSDEQRLTQVMTNLLSNAVKFTPGRGEIFVEAHRLPSEEDGSFLVEISVQDNGIGIAPEHQERLFQSFEQADAGISRRFGGTGLGLAISKNIVESLGGDIWVHSEPGKGSTFTFTFLTKQGEDQSARPHINWQNLRLLVVDRSSKTQHFFGQLSGKHGFTCQVASQWQEAQSLLQKNPPFHILFVDQKIADEEQDILFGPSIWKHTGCLVVMTSTAAWTEMDPNFKPPGVCRYIQKPLFASSIIDCIVDCLTIGNQSKEDLSQLPVLTGRTILLAEDMEINREIVISLLEPAGIAIECAENGLRAVEMFAADPLRYDAIFMDIHMPEMDGYQATRAIRALEFPHAANIPIIAMTANVFREDVERCLDCGMNDHVGKPLDMDEVMYKLQKHLSP